MATPSEPIEPGVVTGALETIDLALQATSAYARPDLTRRLEATRRRVTDPAVYVLVVGEFKQGKSSLVNALVNASICPVDDDVATSAPTVVRFAETAAARAVHEPTDDGEPDIAPIELHDLPLYASEAGNPGNARRLRSVEIGIPRPLLANGLVLVDTPGVGGLGSVHSATTMAALPMADALIFVSDASQELAGPELDFLARAHALCPNVVGVLTKTDLYPEWRRILELDREYLDRAGIVLDLFPLSSTLRQLALEADDRELDTESGFPPLVEYLRDRVVGDAARLTVRSVAHDLVSVVGQLDDKLRSEQSALSDPERVNALVAQLAETKARFAALREQAAQWQVTLNDGIGDLMSDIDHDLRERTRAVQRTADDAIAESAPAQVWDEFEPWLYRRVADEVAGNYALLAQRTNGLADRVAEHFHNAELDVHPSIAVHTPTAVLQRLDVAAELHGERPGASAQGMAALRGTYGGVAMFGMMSTMVGLTMVNPATLFFGVLMGRNALVEEKRRRLAQERQQASAAVRRYLDEVSFQIGKDSRDTLRHLQRQLRDQFQGRAAELMRTTDESMTAAQRVAKATDDERRQRLRDVEAARAQIAAIAARVRALTPASAESPR